MWDQLIRSGQRVRAETATEWGGCVGNGQQLSLLPWEVRERVPA